MFIIKPHIFQRFPQIIYGFSTKFGGDGKSNFDFNLSFSVGDEKSIVESNRKLFFTSIGLNSDSIAFQKQTHSDIIKMVDSAGSCGESDSLITNKRDLGIAITIADCTPIFIFDCKNNVIAGVHSGWRGTEKKILKKTLQLLFSNYNSDCKDLFVYIGPSISTSNYEVGEELVEKFDQKYIASKNSKYFLNVSKANYDMLTEFDVPENQIQKSELCTFEFKTLLHSYRRDREKSGRSIGVIALKE